MGKACGSKCDLTASLDSSGRRQMISTAGNTKYPKPHTLHPRCPECAAEEIAEAELAIRFNNNPALMKQAKDLAEREKQIRAKLQGSK